MQGLERVRAFLFSFQICFCAVSGMPIRNPQVGDKVVYAKDKHSPSPGERAQDVTANAKGDGYTYIVEKYWIVKEVLDDGQLVLKTRRGKEHIISPDDPSLRTASFWEKLFLGGRFPSLD